MTIKVFIADDHNLLMEGFKNYLKGVEVDVVKTSNTLKDLDRKFQNSGADVLVIDLRFNLETQTGLDMAQIILTQNPQAKIVILSQFDNAHIIEKAYKIGALAFVRKDDANSLLDAIKSAAMGKEYITAEIAHKLAIESIRTKNPQKILNPQEIKVFELIADGKTPQQVAELIGLTYKTINIVIGSIRTKLDIETYPEFTKLAVKYGLINLE